VKKFIPSDFSLDIYLIPYGEHPFLNLRRKFSEEKLAKSGLQYQNIVCGTLAETLFGEYLGIFNKDKKALHIWGTGDEKFDVTTSEDTAKYTAAVALDYDVPNGKFVISSECFTFKDMARVWEEVKGEKLSIESKGSLEDLKKYLKKVIEEE